MLEMLVVVYVIWKQVKGKKYSMSTSSIRIVLNLNAICPSLIYESFLVSIQWLINAGMSSGDTIEQWLAPSSSEQCVSEWLADTTNLMTFGAQVFKVQ
jgi:hypothetical protein